MEQTRKLIAALPLKDMEASLLRSALVDGARQAGLDTVLLGDAIDLAAYAHRSQTRANRGSMPRVHYVEHPLRVALRLFRYGCTDADVLVAAVLHDTVEDCAQLIARDFLARDVDERLARDLVLELYAEKFGPVVAHIVDSVSNPLPEEPPVKSAEGRELSNARYVEHVLSVTENPQVFLVKFSDFVDNALSLHHTLVDERNARMVQRLAAKYLPLVTPFTERVLGADLLDFVGETGVTQMLEHLGHSRLDEFAAAA